MPWYPARISLKHPNPPSPPPISAGAPRREHTPVPGSHQAPQHSPLASSQRNPASGCFSAHAFANRFLFLICSCFCESNSVATVSSPALPGSPLHPAPTPRASLCCCDPGRQLPWEAEGRCVQDGGLGFQEQATAPCLARRVTLFLSIDLVTVC